MSPLKTRFKTKRKGLKAGDILVAIIIICSAGYLAYRHQDATIRDDGESNKIEGYPHISDGDSITINNHKIRLLGMDAPELHQSCGEANHTYACGMKAKEYLQQLIDNKKVTCLWDSKDQYNRLLAVCLVDGEPLNVRMVMDGWAVSYYGYPAEEQLAKQQKRGLWSGSFQRPNQWRKENPR